MPSAYRDAAPVEASRYCLYCGGRRDPPDGPCGLCGAAHATEELPASAAEGAPCPRCAAQLSAASLDGAVILRCGSCLGCFVPERAWSAILDRVMTGAPAPLSGFVPLPPGRELSAARLCESVACPFCGRAAERITFAARSEVVVDVCPSHGIWFDAAEIVRAKHFVGERVEHGGVMGRSEEERRDDVQAEGRAEMERLAGRAAVARAQAEARIASSARNRGPGIDDYVLALIDWVTRR